jgi:hypothetical protein
MKWRGERGFRRLEEMGTWPAVSSSLFHWNRPARLTRGKRREHVRRNRKVTWTVDLGSVLAHSTNKMRALLQSKFGTTNPISL